MKLDEDVKPLEIKREKCAQKESLVLISDRTTVPFGRTVGQYGSGERVPIKWFGDFASEQYRVR